MKSRVLRSCSWFSDTPAFLRNGLNASSSPDKSNPLLAFHPTWVTCLKLDGAPISAFVSFFGFPLFWLMKDCCWYGGWIWGGASFAKIKRKCKSRSRSERNLRILMLVGFLRVTDPSSMKFDLLLLLKLLFVIGGGLAGGSLRPPRVRRSAEERKSFATAQLETTFGFFSNFHRNFSVYKQTPHGHSICQKQILEISESWIEERKKLFSERQHEKISPRPSLVRRWVIAAYNYFIDSR